MTPVPVSVVGELLVEAWAPYLTPDLADYANAIGWMFNDVEELVNFLGEEDGWGPLFDPTRCPARALPHLGMYVGERLPVGLTEAMQREWVADHPNQQRGTFYSIIRATQRSLTGARAVMIVERSGAGQTHPEDYLQIRTYAAQTPHPEQVLADIYSVLPADIQLDYSTATSQTWAALKAAKPLWNDVKAAYATWAEVQSSTPGIIVWDRPQPIPS